MNKLLSCPDLIQSTCPARESARLISNGSPKPESAYPGVGYEQYPQQRTLREQGNTHCVGDEAQVVTTQGQDDQNKQELDEEISRLTKRIDFLAGMVYTPKRNTPTVQFKPRQLFENNEQVEFDFTARLNSEAERCNMEYPQENGRKPALRENINLYNVPHNRALYNRNKSRDSRVPRREIPVAQQIELPKRRVSSPSPEYRHREFMQRDMSRSPIQWDDIPRESRRAMRKPPTFSGKDNESWHDWLLNFERIARNARLFDDDVLAMRFGECITGVALSFYNRMTIEEQSSWELTKALFNSRFGIDGNATKGRAELANLFLREGESAVAYKQRFVEAWEKVYPTHGSRTNRCDEIMVDKFLDTINDREACMFIGQKNPQSVDNACEALHSYLIGKARAGRQSICVVANNKQITQKSNTEIDSLKTELSQLKEAIEKLANRNNQNKNNGQNNKNKRPFTQNRWRSPPNYVKEMYKLPELKERKGCWFCGDDKPPRHSIHNCPKRIEQEIKHPGSTVRKTTQVANTAQTEEQLN